MNLNDIAKSCHDEDSARAFLEDSVGKDAHYDGRSSGLWWSRQALSPSQHDSSFLKGVPS